MRARPRPSRSRSLLSRGLTGEGMATVRCAVGALLLVRPRSVVDVLGGDPALSPAGDWAVRMLAGRDLALGLGGLVAARDRPRNAPLWLLAGALSDAVDAVVLTRALARGGLGRTRSNRALAGLCTAAAVTAVVVQVRDAAR